MSKLIRVSDETTTRWEPWQAPKDTADRLVRRILDAAELDAMTCGICGTRAEMTEEMMDRWFPEVWLINPDGSEVSIGVACDLHKCSYDEESGAYLARVDSQGNYPE